jgi:hypothetical protein
MSSVIALGLITVGSHTALPAPSALVAPTVSVLSTCRQNSGRATGTASVVIVDSAGSRRLDFSSEVNLVFCRQPSPSMTWVRIDQSPENNGGEGPHLDIDICFLSDGGTFRPMEARAQPCPGGKTWAVWWHETATRVFATPATSSPCELQVAVERPRLTGTFSCRGSISNGGTESIDVLQGHFECTLEAAPGDGDRASQTALGRPSRLPPTLQPTPPYRQPGSRRWRSELGESDEAPAAVVPW